MQRTSSLPLRRPEDIDAPDRSCLCPKPSPPCFSYPYPPPMHGRQACQTSGSIAMRISELAHRRTFCRHRQRPYSIRGIDGERLMRQFKTAWREILVASLVVLSFCGLAVAQEPRRGFYTPLAADAVHSIPAEHGMVVAQEKVAARIGTDVLRRGGNAIDAAVATGFAMAVTYPRAGNIGGGGFMVIHSVDGHEDVAIDYRETAPAATTPTIFLGP